MLRVRRSNERGHFNHGWLETYHTFSFADYHDPAHHHFRTLRVMNEDRVMPGQGFGMHGHRDMEIVTYVLDGKLEHRDSMGNGEVLTPGEFQRMSAGTGVMHSEFNPSAIDPVHLYQIWIMPAAKGMPPEYEQKRFEQEGRHNRFQLVASPDGRDGSLTIHQDACIMLGNVDAEQALNYEIVPGRHAWLQVMRGSITANGQSLSAGDGLAASDEIRLRIVASTSAELMLFDLS